MYGSTKSNRGGEKRGCALARLIKGDVRTEQVDRVLVWEYLEIAKSKSTPAEVVNRCERQRRAVKCSVVGGEPVDQRVGIHLISFSFLERANPQGYEITCSYSLNSCP